MIVKESLSLTEKAILVIENLIEQQYLNDSIKITNSGDTIYLYSQEQDHLFTFCTHNLEEHVLYDNGRFRKKILYRQLRDVITRDIVNRVNKLQNIL